MIKEKPLYSLTITDQRYRIIGVHKTKGQRKGSLRFDTYHGAKIYIDKHLLKHPNSKNYVCFLIDKEV